VGNGDALAEHGGNGEAPAMQFPDDRGGQLPNFTRPASDIINKARRIARELNHTSVSPAHLALALTLDSRSSRRLRDQGVDVDLAREAVVRHLAKYNCTYTSGALPLEADPKASPDLSDIMVAATRFAHEREDEEEINISDLLDAFRKSGSGAKLLYAVSEAPTRFRPSSAASNRALLSNSSSCSWRWRDVCK
jgi:ATP-dependent Clp protease ATP-binding subunit ClpA